MKRIIGIALISLSVSILLLHSFVPHHHSSRNLNLQEILVNDPVKSPLDLLKVGLHLNLGANHLENFEKSKSLAAEKAVNKEKANFQNFFPTSLQVDLSLSTECQEAIPPRSIGSILIQYNNSFSYRGPPTFA